MRVLTEVGELQQRPSSSAKESVRRRRGRLDLAPSASSGKNHTRVFCSGTSVGRRFCVGPRRLLGSLPAASVVDRREVERRCVQMRRASSRVASSLRRRGAVFILELGRAGLGRAPGLWFGSFCFCTSLSSIGGGPQLGVGTARRVPRALKGPGRAVSCWTAD